MLSKPGNFIFKVCKEMFKLKSLQCAVLVLKIKAYTSPFSREELVTKPSVTHPSFCSCIL